MRPVAVALLPVLALSAPLLAKDSSEVELIEREELRTVAMIPEMMEAFGVSGLAVAVVSDDRVRVTRGFGETQDGETFTASTQCGLYSATKTLASLTYTSLAASGMIDLQAPLTSYLGDAPSEWGSIPFYRLLNHSSGIATAVDKKAFETLSEDPASTNEDVYRLVRDEPLEFLPGEYSRYRQSGYAIGEMILEAKLGRPFASLVDEVVIKPAGLTSTSHPATRDDTQSKLIMSAGGYTTTAQDMARLFTAMNDGRVVSPSEWKALLLRDEFRFDDYSLGSVIEEHEGVLTVGHSGGGARANIRYAPDARIGAMVCTDDRTNGGLAMHLARMLVQEIHSGDMPELPLLMALSGYEDMSGPEVIAALEKAESMGAHYNFTQTEALLNGIGYDYLYDDKTTDAVTVLAYNMARFPNSPNAHDSLGEALLTSGDMQAALERYRYVLELDPGNANATKMIAGILRNMGGAAQDE